MSSPNKHCLLVVDDEADVCDSVYDLLRREFHVLKARSAAEGYKLMRDNEVHIIMTDQRMPHSSGVELLSTVRAHHPKAVRILFTGYADLESVIAAINQGHVYQFLKKPWHPEELEVAVRVAAAEYERLVAEADLVGKLQAEMSSLRERLAVVEAEVKALRAAPQTGEK